MRKLGVGRRPARRPVRVFLLDDDRLRHDWFAKRFKGDDTLDLTDDPASAVEMLASANYDVLFLDHDLLPEHYHAETHDDASTGYAVAEWLAAHPEHQPSAAIIVHTRNGDAARRMVERLREAGRAADYVPFPLLSPTIKNRWQR